MASLKDLERDLARALKAGDLDQIASVRRTIASGFADTPAAAEANYRLGLDLLFRTKNVDEAAAHLREAAKTKAAPWSIAARVSLGLVMLRQGKAQQAIFELRRVAGSQLDPAVVETFETMILERGIGFRHTDAADFEIELAFDKRVADYARPRLTAA